MQRRASMPGLLAAGCLAGLAGLSACEREPDAPSGTALSECYKAVEHGLLAVDFADALSASDKRLATAQLEDARNRVLVAWADREGMDLPARAIVEEEAEARSFLDGVEAEAGLSEQARLSALSEASGNPADWRGTFDGALKCAEEVEINGT
jgi:hypothetical protein